MQIYDISRIKTANFHHETKGKFIALFLTISSQILNLIENFING